jgi:adenylate kinase
MRIVLLGPPGSGKGTQAKLVEQRLGMPQISTGDIFRKAIAGKTELGVEVEKYLSAGALVPDDLTTGLVRERLMQKDAEKGFVLDGFPRTLGQAAGIEGILREHGWELDAVVHINVSAETLVPRLASRRTCPSCGMMFHLEHRPPDEEGRCTVCGTPVVTREDDGEETIRKRLAVYFAQTAALTDYYRKKSKLIDVDGEGEVEEVFARMLAALKQRGKVPGGTETRR